MTDIDEFLASNGWSDARQESLTGDASSRSYMRLYLGEKRAILMIDPQDDTQRFINIAEHLSASGVSSPEIFARAPGMLLLEDFGDAQVATVVAKTPQLEVPIYRTVVDTLLEVQKSPAPGNLDIATPQSFAAMIAPVFDHYAAAFTDRTTQDATHLETRLADLLDAQLIEKPVLVLRDHHAENMMWLPDRQSFRRIGLLDFQDALCGPPVYDLVSMLQDARRDVSEACRSSSIAHFVEKRGSTMDATLAVYHLIGLQRNLRILGIFTRLARDRSKPGYLDLIPRVWGHIETCLQHPVVAPLSDHVKTAIPAPTPDRLQKVKTACQMP